MYPLDALPINLHALALLELVRVASYRRRYVRIADRAQLFAQLVPFERDVDLLQVAARARDDGHRESVHQFV
jgi:hypothetical protein